MNKKLIIFSVCLPLFLLLFSYKTTLYFTDLTENQQKVLNYLDETEELKLNYTAQEISHLNDVRIIMNLMNYLFYGLLLMLTLIITYYKPKINLLQKLFKYGGIATVSLIMLILMFSLVNFNYTFEIFHQLFFPQGNYIFSTGSLLIQAFPEPFFIKASQLIFLQTVGYGIVFILLSLYFSNVHHRQRD